MRRDPDHRGAIRTRDVADREHGRAVFMFQIVDDMELNWASSSPAVLEAGTDLGTFHGARPGSLRLEVHPGAVGATVEKDLGVPLDLHAFDELRFWIRSTRAADGSRARPFALEVSYLDNGDAAGETHQWLVPVNQPRIWELRRIGIQGDRRGAVQRLRFRCLTDAPMVCHIDEMSAVREELLADVEQALSARIAPGLVFPPLNDLALFQPAAPGDTAIELPAVAGFRTGNQVRIRGGSAGEETHAVIQVVPSATTTTLRFDPADSLLGNLAVATARVDLAVPILVENPPSASPTPTPTPAVFLTQIEAREDAGRTTPMTQRDSFRVVSGRTVCSVRPGPRAYTVDYQLTVIAPERAQHLAISSGLLQRLSMDTGIAINGEPAPLVMLPPPPLERRELGGLAPLYVRIGTRAETAPREQRPWVRRAEVESGRIDAPLDSERIEVIL